MGVVPILIFGGSRISGVCMKKVRGPKL